MFRNRSDLITAIIIYGILGRCERVCKKFEWTEKKNETNRPTDRPTRVVLPRSPLRCRRANGPTDSISWSAEQRAGNTKRALAKQRTRTTIYYYYCSRMTGTRVWGGFFIFIFAIRTEPSCSLTRHVIIAMIILGHWAQCHNTHKWKSKTLI